MAVSKDAGQSGFVGLFNKMIGRAVRRAGQGNSTESRGRGTRLSTPCGAASPAGRL
jgi:hypothetical protein